MPESGYRRTLVPGDCILFDPAKAHGLVKPGSARFEPSDWSAEELVDVEAFSLMLSVEVPLQAALDPCMGVRRGTWPQLRRQGHRMRVDLSVDKHTGAWAHPR